MIFNLTQEQTEFLRPIAEQVRAAWAAGEPGSVVAQIGSDDEDHLIANCLTTVKVEFFPAEVAAQLQAVIRAYHAALNQEAQP
jgi:hypothetical protein